VSGAVRVVCFGNPWHGDDGFGLHVLRRLPGEVDAFDAGTAGLDALPYLESCAKAVLVDAVRTGAPVGTVQSSPRPTSRLPAASTACTSSD
jgi:hydrogenase maturation protease